MEIRTYLQDATFLADFKYAIDVICNFSYGRKMQFFNMMVPGTFTGAAPLELRRIIYVHSFKIYGVKNEYKCNRILHLFHI